MSCDYKVEDLIRVIRRVDTYHTPAPGDRGFVTMVERDRAHLTILGSEGKVHAYTGAPLTHLEHERDPVWVEAKRLHDERSRMTPFKVGDLIRITENGPGVWHDVAGSRGFIEELTPCGTQARVYLLDREGHVKAVGAHPTRLMAHEDAPEWQRALQLHKLEEAALTKRYEKRTESWNKHVAKIAAEFDLTPESAKAIHNRMLAWEGNQHG
jgi:hypothetical protein